MKRAARFKPGSVVFDKRRKTWNFLRWVDGKRRSQRIGTLQEFPTKGAAWRAVQRINSSTEFPSPKTEETVGSVIARYEVERMPARFSTAQTYRSFLKNHVIPRWGDTLIEDVQPRPVELWLRGLPLSPKSKTHVRSLMHGLLEFAMFAGIIDVGRNPISLVQNRGASKRVRKPRSLTVEQFRSLLAELHEPFATIALVCVCLGLRISETLALKWADVDWLGSKLSVRRGIVQQHVDDCKTEGSAKTFVLASNLLERLKAWKQVSQFPDGDDWIFASPFNIGRLPYSYTGTRQELVRAANAAGLGHLSTHAFRHSYRSWLDAVGTPIAVQQKMMRHTDIRTTMNVYGDVVTDEMSTASTKIAELVFQPNGSLTDRESS
jgi:integrase